jgi:hypothetical protein
MIDLAAIKVVIVRGLQAHLNGVTVSMSNAEEKMPPYPFVTWDIIDIDDDDFSFTFNAHTNNKMDAALLAQQARDWFLGPGHQALKDAVNVVVVTVEPADNRDVQIGAMWERKYGFDVDFRTVGIIEGEYTDEVIETAHIERVE